MSSESLGHQPDTPATFSDRTLADELARMRTEALNSPAAYTAEELFARLPEPTQIPAMSEQGNLAYDGQATIFEGTRSFRSRRATPIETNDAPTIAEAFSHPGNIMVRHGFNMEAEFRPDQLPGPIVEIGGPTQAGFHIVNRLGTMPEQVAVSNVTTQPKSMEDARLDFVADGRRMPFADNSLGAVMFSALGGTGDNKATAAQLRTETFAETMRILAPGGLVIAQGLYPQEAEQATQNGLAIEAAWLTDAGHSPRGDDIALMAVVYRKPDNHERQEPTRK